MPLLLAPAAAMKMTSQIGKALRSGSKATKSLDNAGDIAKVVPPTDKSDGIFAFHGSADDFDEFKLSKIGTGEGAQAFGSGLYFTDSKDIAKFYKEGVRGFKDLQGKVEYNYKGKIFKLTSDTAKTKEELGVAKIIENAISTNKYPEKAKENLIKILEKDIKTAQSRNDTSDISDLLIKSYKKDLDAIKNINISNFEQSKGKTYEVNIKTVTDNLLDYDKPLSEQSETVKKVIESLRMNISPKTKGSQIYEKIGSVLSEPPFNNTISNTTNPVTSKKVSEKLNSLGVKGIKYNAGKLSGKESNATNYVIFDDKIIDVMAKYGIVGAIGVSAMQGASGGTEGDILPPGAI